MTSRVLTVVLCLLAVAGVVASLGCANAYTEERMRRRQYVAEKDANRIVNDVDWLLGLDEPSTLYEDSFPPGP